MNARLHPIRAVSKLIGISVDRRVGSLLLAGLVASAVTVAMMGNAPYALTVIWALIAMAVNQFSRATPARSTTFCAVAVGMELLVGTTLLVSRGRRARSVLRSGELVTF